MSVRSYRINSIETENEPSFNLWHDTELMDYLEESGDYSDNLQDSGGQIEVSVESLKEAVESKELNLDEDLKASLLADIKWAEKKGEDYIQYYCY